MSSAISLRSRSPWQAFYGAVHRLRRRWFANRAARLPRPVISVGNLHWGGSGKTPLAAAIATHLVARGLATAILSRGYGRQDRQIRIVSTGEGPLLGPSVAGDEPVLLAGEVPGAAVVVAPDRYEAGRHALERLDPAPDVFVLDDGFSHLGLAREVDLLVFPVTDPLAGGRLWPGGGLREPLHSAAHADALLLSGGTQAEADALAESLAEVGFTGPGFGCARQYLPPRSVTGEPLPSATRVVVVSGIARSGDFERQVERLDVEVTGSLSFGDHHPYPEASLREIRRLFTERGAERVLTTAKDRVKLLGRLDLPLAELPLRAAPDPSFWPWLDARLAEVSE